MNKQITEFGKLCRSYRAKLGMTMTQFAEKTGKKQSIITRIEQGNYPLSLEYIKQSIDTYGIREKSEQMEFLLSCFRSIDRFEIPLKELGSLGKEWLAAIFIWGNIKKFDPKGWDELLIWIKDFSAKLDAQIPKSVTLGDTTPF